jgi:hypothetical protein
LRRIRRGTRFKVTLGTRLLADTRERLVKKYARTIGVLKGAERT